jgi:CO dehydrogenase maturation factor
LRLNPQVDDIPERFALQKDGIKLLVMGTIRQGGSGCACPHNTLLKSLLAHIVLERNELVLLDLEAGLEPLGRATAQGVDAMLIVVEPDQVSFSTAGRIHKLAQDIGIKNLLAVANKVRGSADLAYIQQHLPSPLTLLGSVPYSDALRRSGGDKIEDEAVLPGIQEILKGLKTSLSVSVNKL